MDAIDDKDLDRIEAFHRGALPAGEERQLRDKIAADPSFARGVGEHEAFLRQFQPTAAEIAEAAAYKATFVARQKDAGKPTKVRKLPRWVMGAVAALLAGVLIYTGWRMSSPDPGSELLAESVPHFTPLNRLSVRLSGDGVSTADQLKSAYAAYDTGDYAAASPVLNTPSAVAADSLNLLFGAVAELGLGKPARAIPVLENLRASSLYAANAAEINFYLALAYLDTGERAKAVDLLELTRDMPGAYGEEAGFLLDEIEKK